MGGPRADKAIRWRPETGFEMRCNTCLEYWPLDAGAWYPARGLGRCLPCLRDRDAGRSSRYYREHRDFINAMRRAGYDARVERIARRIRYEAHRARMADDAAYRERHLRRSAAASRAWRARQAA